MTEPIQESQDVDVTGIKLPNAIWPDANVLPEWAMLSTHLEQVVKTRDMYSTYRINFGRVPIGDLL